MSRGFIRASGIALLVAMGWRPVAGHAQWTSDPMVNTPVCGAADDQVQPKIRNAPNGDSVVSWFDNRTGGYDVYVQRLDEDGLALWAADGVLVADRSVSSTEDYGLAVDAQGNAVLAYGTVNFSSLAAQKIDAAGNLLWGAGGVSFNTPGGSHSPKVAATSDGAWVVAWSEGSPLGVVLQKLDANGSPQWGPGGVVYTDPPNPASRSLFICDLQPADAGSVIVLWFRCAGSNCTTSAHHLYAQKYDAGGTPVWNGGSPVIVFDGSSTANGYFPTFLPDGTGGAVFGWYETGGSQLCYVQRLTAAGAEVYPHNGVACTVATPGRMRISASLGFDEASGEMFMAWSEVTIPTQNMWGVRAQKISAGGARQWGDEGVVLVPLGTNQTGFCRAASLEAGCIAAWFIDQGGGAGFLQATRLDAAGAAVWSGSPLAVSNRPTGKARLDTALDGCGMLRLVWSDGPGGGGQDVLAQNLRPQGVLGPLPFVAGDMDCDLAVTPDDIPGFALALADPVAYAASHPCCPPARADASGDTREDGLDCQGFVDLLLAP
jgi:hypothetical protein